MTKIFHLLNYIVYQLDPYFWTLGLYTMNLKRVVINFSVPAVCTHKSSLKDKFFETELFVQCLRTNRDFNHFALILAVHDNSRISEPLWITKSFKLTLHIQMMLNNCEVHIIL